jgi:hypothetical protein
LGVRLAHRASIRRVRCIRSTRAEPASISRPLLGVSLDVGAGGLWPARKINKIGNNVERLVALRINQRFFGVVGCADCVSVVIRRCFGRNFPASLFRFG